MNSFIRNLLAYGIPLGMLLMQGACKKYLDARSNKSLVIITSTRDCQALLDGVDIINEKFIAPMLIASDEFYVPYSVWAAQTGTVNRQELHDHYIWYGEALLNSGWGGHYRTVYFCNVVLEALGKLNGGNKSDITGQALFNRGYAFYMLAQMFCRPYTVTAASDWGIPLRLIPDIEAASVRATVAQAYQQVINDLKLSVALLPERSAAYTRPNKTAAFAALTRVYLSMRDYANAGKYADSSLQKYSTLINYNTIDANSGGPLSNNSNEIIWSSHSSSYSILPGSVFIDTTLYGLYADNDLRKQVLFRQNGSDHVFKGSYFTANDGTQIPFSGLATNELYLTRAECAARAGYKDSAMNDLNRLLNTRWKAGTFTPLAAFSTLDALQQVLTERRKELILRGSRWTDLRRLNEEGANITLTRNLNGTVYVLPPQDLRWVLLIPQSVINLSNLQQNPR